MFNYVLIFSLLWLAITAGCANGVNQNNQSISNTVNNQSTVSVTPDISRKPGDVKVFVKKEGWTIPEYTAEKTTKFIEKSKDSNSPVNKVEVIEIEPENQLITDEPFKSVNFDLGQVLYKTRREYKLKNHTFCIRIRAQRVTVDSDSKTIKSASGSLFFFAYYDEDGDGKFESLVLDETDSSGINSFYSFPHIPKWLL